MILSKFDLNIYCKQQVSNAFGKAFAFYSFESEKELHEDLEVFIASGTTPDGVDAKDIIDVGGGVSIDGVYTSIKYIQYIVIKNKSTVSGDVLFFDVNHDEKPLEGIFLSSSDILKIGPSGTFIFGSHLFKVDATLTYKYFRLYSNQQAIPYEVFVIGKS